MKKEYRLLFAIVGIEFTAVVNAGTNWHWPIIQTLSVFFILAGGTSMMLLRRKAATPPTAGETGSTILGAPPPKPLKGAIISGCVKYGGKYGATLGMLIGYIPLFLYPVFVAWMNPIPAQQDLIHVTGKILKARNYHPQLVIELPNKTIQEIDFPVQAYLQGLIGDPKFYGLSDEELRRLPNCIADIGYDPIRWSFPKRTRIWELRCERLNWSYEQASTYYKTRCQFGTFELVTHTLMLFLLIAVLVKESKEK